MKEYIEREAAIQLIQTEGFNEAYDLGSRRDNQLFCAEVERIPTADVVEVDSVIPFVRVCDRKEYIKNSEKLINEYLAELLERFGVRCLAQSDNINGTVKFWAEKMDGGVDA